MSAWLFITAPGLFMGLYVPPFAAALLAAFLQSRDRSGATHGTAANNTTS